jgi:hypothetical protein
MKNKQLTVLVLSCDKYQDLWKPLFYSFNKYWKDCPYPIHLGSNTVSYKSKKISTILSGPDADWSTSLLRILKKVKTPYIFLWLDDIFPSRPLDTATFASALDFMVGHKAKHLHIQPTPQPDEVLTGGEYGMYKKGAPYRAITFGFWEVAALKQLLIPGENPWNFEILGSYRSSYTDGFYCTMKNIVPRVHVVEKGKIFPEAYAYCKKHGIPLDTKTRQVLEKGFFLKSELQKYYFNIVIQIPWSIRVKVMGLLRKLLISY